MAAQIVSLRNMMNFVFVIPFLVLAAIKIPSFPPNAYLIAKMTLTFALISCLKDMTYLMTNILTLL
jgi:hypothetical protein